MSIADCPALNPKWSGEMAPVSLPAHAILWDRFNSKVLLSQDSRKLGRRLFGINLCVLPALGLGTHFPCFHGGGKPEWCRRLLNRSLRILGLAYMVLSIMALDTPSTTAA